jgi:hypothetical protein
MTPNKAVVAMSGGVDSSVAAARRVAETIGIPFRLLDASVAFLSGVVEPMIRAYASGRTPNPCLECNRLVRWDFLLRQALVPARSSWPRVITRGSAGGRIDTRSNGPPTSAKTNPTCSRFSGRRGWQPLVLLIPSYLFS